MKKLLDSLVVLVIIGAFVFAGFVLTAFGTVIVGAFYLVATAGVMIISAVIIVCGTIAVLFSPKKKIDTERRKR